MHELRTSVVTYRIWFLSSRALDGPRDLEIACVTSRTLDDSLFLAAFNSGPEHKCAARLAISNIPPSSCLLFLRNVFSTHVKCKKVRPIRSSGGYLIQVIDSKVESFRAKSFYERFAIQNIPIASRLQTSRLPSNRDQFARFHLARRCNATIFTGKRLQDPIFRRRNFPSRGSFSGSRPQVWRNLGEAGLPADRDPSPADTLVLVKTERPSQWRWLL